jgi:hypothetical protein
MNVGLKWPIAWNHSRHVHSWRSNLHCGIEETGSAGVICIVCHQVLCHPLAHETRTMGKHLLANAHIAKLNELTLSEVTELTSSTVDETALAIHKRRASCGIPIVSSENKFKFTIQLLCLLTQLTDKTLQTGSKGLSNCRISPTQVGLLPHGRIYFGSSCMEHNIKH